MRPTTPKILCTLVAALLAAIALPPAAGAASVSTDWCGTHENGLIESLAIHYDNQRRLARERPQRVAALSAGTTAGSSAATVTAVGDLVVIEDDGSVLIPRKFFDLDVSGLRFKSKKKAPELYKLGGLGARIGTNLGDKLPLGDDDSVKVELPFSFTFYGVAYDEMWVNSDGNITFQRGDSSSFDRDLARVLNGAPRIAPFFEDYDPTSGTGDSGVYLRFTPNNKKAIVTWYRVPRFGESNENTFQVEISKNRQVKMRYGNVDGTEGIVGIAPGGGSPLTTVDFSEDRGDQYDTAIAERFSSSQSVDEPMVAQAFYSQFADQYSHLVVFTDFGLILGSPGTIAFERNISNTVRGIGLGIYDAGGIYGSSRPLESFVMMGNIAKYDRDVFARQFLSNLFAPIDILLHEVGHRWLFFASISQNGLSSDQLRGRGDAHWSFYTHSEGSLLEGSFLEPRPAGGFISTDVQRTYSGFDLYLMGAIAADEVAPIFTVTGPEADKASVAPEPDRVVIGDDVDVTIDDLRRAEGPRVPAADDAPKTITMAIILLVREGETPSADTLAHLEDFRQGLEREFRRRTGRELRVDTTLVPK